MTTSKQPKTSSTRGRRNRERGKEGEREIANLCTQDLGIPTKRILGQERDGGQDVPIGRLLAQVKRRKRIGGVYEWLEGADVLCMRGDGKEWLVVMRWPLFVELAREEICKT